MKRKKYLKELNSLNYQKKKKLFIEWKKHLKELIEEEKLKSQKAWNKESEFGDIKQVSIDGRGSIGEKMVVYFLSQLPNSKIINIGSGHNDYDLIVNDVKIEVKSATLDSNNKFQHEGVKSSKEWDMIAFFDLSPNNLHVIFLHKNRFDFTNETVRIKNKIRNLHFRGKDNTVKNATGPGYKLDLKTVDLYEVDSDTKVMTLFQDELKLHSNKNGLKT